MKNDTQEETKEVATFDHEAFRASVLDEVNKAINSMNKEIGKLTKAMATPKPEPSATEEQPKANPAVPAEVNAELQKRDRELAKLTDIVGKLTNERDSERTARMESERVAAIKDAMNGIQFRDEQASRAFFKMITNDVTRDEDGNLVAKTDKGFLPVDEHIKNTADTLPGLLAAQGRGGSGAVPGKVSGKTFTLDDIKPGMSKEQQDAVWSHIRSIPPAA